MRSGAIWAKCGEHRKKLSANSHFIFSHFRGMARRLWQSFGFSALGSCGQGLTLKEGRG